MEDVYWLLLTYKATFFFISCCHIKCREEKVKESGMLILIKHEMHFPEEKRTALLFFIYCQQNSTQNSIFYAEKDIPAINYLHLFIYAVLIIK